jgi:hypothetical protein
MSAHRRIYSRVVPPSRARIKVSRELPFMLDEKVGSKTQLTRHHRLHLHRSPTSRLEEHRSREERDPKVRRYVRVNGRIVVGDLLLPSVNVSAE